MKRVIRKNPNQVVIYYWYDRGEIRRTKDQEIIETAILNHDFDTFMKMREKYPPDTDGGFVYFPDTASIFEGDEHVGELDITTPENFAKIDDEGFEWG